MKVVGLLPSVFVGYVLTIAVETVVLLLALSKRHPMRRRIVAGIWLTACSYPFVAFVFPLLLPVASWPYTVVSEIFAPLSECGLFWLVYDRQDSVSSPDWRRDMLAVLLANLASFAVGEMLKGLGWLEFVD